MPNLHTLLFGDRSQVGRRLIVLIIAFSVLTTLCISMVQLSVEYRDLNRALERDLERVQIYVPSIAGSVWDFDDKQVKRMLGALILLPNIVQASVATSDTQSHWSVGKSLSDNVVTRVYPLRQPVRGADSEIGTLTVVASLDGIDQQIGARAISILLSTALAIFLVALFLVYLIRRLITSRLEKLGRKVHEMIPRILPLRHSEGFEPQPIPASLDELDAVDWALDRTVEKLDLTLSALANTNEELRRHQEHLEERVRERTVELLAAREAAEAANLAKSSFLSSMSHELRTPLNSVLGYAQLFAMDQHASRNTRDNAAEIEKAGKHLLALVNDILDLARIESGRMEMHIEDVALDEVLADCRRIIEAPAQESNIRLELPEIPVLLRADRMRLKQALLNLLSNAVKYNCHGGQVLVHGTRAPEGRYRISVSDNGPGIPAERLGDLFQPFNRLGAERGSVQGTGIGLVITKTLVESMAGRIGVESPAGTGATFWVELPLASA